MIQHEGRNGRAAYDNSTCVESLLGKMLKFREIKQLAEHHSAQRKFVLKFAFV
jgi:hypothetical protein